MRRCLKVVACLFFIELPTNLSAQEYVTLDTYSCADFLGDIKQPENGARVLRSLMMISWATGFASAHQPGAPKADPSAIQAIATMLGSACRYDPSQNVVHATVAALDAIAKAEALSGAMPKSIDTSPKQQGGFTIYDNFDLPQGDLRRLEGVELSKCVATCESDRECKAYSYDKWNRWCFLKSNIATLTLDPASISGVRKAVDVPQEATSPIRIEPLVSKALRGSSYRTSSLKSAQGCQQSCEQDRKCLGFTFTTSRQRCELFDNIKTVDRGSGVTSGYKTQSNP